MISIDTRIAFVQMFICPQLFMNLQVQVMHMQVIGSNKITPIIIFILVIRILLDVRKKAACARSDLKMPIKLCHE